MRAPDAEPVMTWAFVLEEGEDASTRLLVRAPGSRDYPFYGLPQWLGMVHLRGISLGREIVRGRNATESGFAAIHGQDGWNAPCSSYRAVAVVALASLDALARET